MSDLSLDNIVTNDMNFKHLETTKDITISIKNENGFPQRPDATHTWTAKVSDGTNYIGDYAVKINQNNVIVDSEDFTKLPTGSYQLEVWEEWNDPDGTKQRSIYPSPSQTIPFTIYANITDQAEKEIKSIGFQDVVDQAVMNIGMNYVFKVNTIEPDQTATVVQSAADGKNYVTFNIPRGDKGDKGDTPDLSNCVTVTDLNNGLSTKVTDNKNGTISLNGTSIIPANENVIGRIDGAYKDMNDIPAGWMYLNGWADVSELANWGLPKDFYFVHCFKTTFSIPATIQIAYGLNNNVYTRTMNSTSWSTWKLLADDSQAVHNTGNETIAGDKAFVGNTTLATTTILEGNYGLRVTSSGIQKTTDGKTWVPANI